MAPSSHCSSLERTQEKDRWESYFPSWLQRVANVIDYVVDIKSSSWEMMRCCCKCALALPGSYVPDNVKVPSCTSPWKHPGNDDNLEVTSGERDDKDKPACRVRATEEDSWNVHVLETMQDVWQLSGSRDYRNIWRANNKASVILLIRMALMKILFF